MWKRILLVVFILFCIELGLFLVVLPWSDLWERNFFLTFFPGARPFALSNYLRGAITGLGVVNLWVGLADAWNFRENLARLEKAHKEKPDPGTLNAETAALRPPRSGGR